MHILALIPWWEGVCFQFYSQQRSNNWTRTHSFHLRTLLPNQWATPTQHNLSLTLWNLYMAKACGASTRVFKNCLSSTFTPALHKTIINSLMTYHQLFAKLPTNFKIKSPTIKNSNGHHFIFQDNHSGNAHFKNLLHEIVFFFRS